MTDSHLLPINATPLEQAVSLAVDPAPQLGSPITAMRGIKFNPPSSLLNHLIWEYGLTELRPYVADLSQLIDEGIDWQRIRGTFKAVLNALLWAGYTATLEEFPTRRRLWARFMLELDRIRDNEQVDLRAIDGLSNLSVPERSTFWRGFHGYDVRATDFGYTKLANTLLSTFSGVRIEGAGAKWSFGRRYEHEHGLTEAEMTQLGVYIAGDADGLGWGAFTWEEADASWNEQGARERLIMAGLNERTVWLELKDSTDNIIGYRRARVARIVNLQIDGSYQIGADTYAETFGGIHFYLEAMTDFGDGNGKTATSYGWVFDATIKPEHKPGLLWAEPDQLENLSPAIAINQQSVEFGETVRERFVSLLNVGE